MPIRDFICPDGQRISPTECLKEGGCRRGEGTKFQRCATRNYLKLASREREWRGVPSTTQLIQGTLCAFLKISKPYDITPDSRAFMINGTMAHAKLETQGDEISKVEEVFAEEQVSGIADIIEEECGRVTLWDYKTSGSFKVGKALGWKVVEVESDEVYKSGKKKGQKKTIKELRQDKAYVDVREWELQLNFYRLLAQKKLGKKIDALKVQVIVRDGGTYIARGRGIVRNLYVIEIPIIRDEEIEGYFEKKRKDLLKALKQGYWKEICSKEENWDGLKCKRYCEVAGYCNYGKYLKKERETEEKMILGLSEIVRMPRLGHIRLGIKKTNSNGKEYPVDVDYFTLDPATPVEGEREKLIKEFETLFGDEKDGKVRSIKIMFPVDDEEILFPQFYKRYGSSSLQCKGDGQEGVCGSKEFAANLTTLQWLPCEEEGVKVKCDGRNCVYYQNKKCKENAVLNVLIPELPGVGVWQIVTGSFNSIVNVNSGIKTIRAIAGRVNMIPLTLIRIPQETTYNGRKAIHYPLMIDTNIKIASLQRLASIDPSKSLLPEINVSSVDLILADGSSVDSETGEINEGIEFPG
jgi:hypothetical protein